MKKYHLILAAIMTCGFAVPTSAQTIKPRAECRSMKQPIACECALQNGGEIYVDQHNPKLKRWRTATGPAHMAFMNCTAQAQ